MLVTGKLTNGDVIFTVKEQTDKHFVSQDTGFSDEQILFYLLQCRNLFISRKLNTNHSVNSQNRMTTPCINLVEADNNCPCIPPSDCIALMTEQYIPLAISEIISVTNPDNSVEYIKSSSNLDKYRRSQRISFFANKTAYYEQNTGSGTKLYVISNKPLKNIVVTLIPAFPEQIQRMLDCKGNNDKECVSTYDLDWIADPDITKSCIDETINILLRSRMQSSDVKNDGVDSNIANKQEILN